MTDMPPVHRPTSRAARLRTLLIGPLSPEKIEIVDDSARHEGHAGARPEGETHYTILVVTSRFEGMTRVARSRLVHDLLAPEFTSGMHALSLVLRTPAEHRGSLGTAATPT